MSQADRETVFAAFAMDPPQATKTKEPKAEKKPRANAGKGTAWSAFSVKIQLDHKDEVDAVKKDAAQRRANAKMSGLAAPDDTKGAHLHWCSAYKAAHEDEWKAFKAEWELKNKAVSEETAPMVGGGSTSAATAAPGVATVATAATTEAAPKPKRGPKKLADMTPEEQAAAKAKRAENKAKKASAANSADVSRSPSPPKVKDE